VYEGYGSHGNNESCTIEVLQTGTLDVEYFDINTCSDGTCDCDYLEVGGKKYCGPNIADGPQGIAVTAGYTFEWVSDHNETGSGWTVCLSNLVVTSGSDYCQVSGEGNCVTSGPSDYGNNEACSIEVMEDGALFSKDSFDVVSSTNCADDALIIGNERYCGNNTGPQGVQVVAGSTFTWESDGSDTSAGWTICLNTLHVTSGNEHCQLRKGGKCVWEGFGQHKNNESCSVDVLAAGMLSVTYMDIQVCGEGTNCSCDYLEVNDQRYCGKTSAGPRDVVSTPGSSFNWHSDQNYTQGGFTICLTNDYPPITEAPTTSSPALSPTVSPSATGNSNGASSLWTANFWMSIFLTTSTVMITGF